MSEKCHFRTLVIGRPPQKTQGLCSLHTVQSLDASERCRGGAAHVATLSERCNLLLAELQPALDTGFHVPPKQNASVHAGPWLHGECRLS